MKHMKGMFCWCDSLHSREHTTTPQKKDNTEDKRSEKIIKQSKFQTWNKEGEEQMGIDSAEWNIARNIETTSGHRQKGITDGRKQSFSSN